jgi:hypothetical protein
MAMAPEDRNLLFGKSFELPGKENKAPRANMPWVARVSRQQDEIHPLGDRCIKNPLRSEIGSFSDVLAQSRWHTRYRAQGTMKIEVRRL